MNIATLITSGSFTENTVSGMSASPREVTDRLYGRSSSVQKIGRERREEIESRLRCNFTSSQPPSSIVMRDSNKDSRNYEGYSPEEITQRLYGRSYESQKVGRERRDEIDKARALSNARAPIRLSVSPPPSIVPALPRRNTITSARVNASPSPEEISSRLYGRSVQGQQAGKDRREKVCQMRPTSLPRMNVHCSFPGPAPSEEFSPETISSRPVSTKDTVDRLYSRSLQCQENGRERRTEIDRVRELSNPVPAMRVRASSPTPQRRVAVDSTAD